MIPQLASALAGGYSTKQIMQLLIRQFPQHADKIKGALKAGFTADQVVKFLGGGRKAVNQESEGLTEHEQTRSKDILRRENVNQGALKGAGMAALAGGASLAAPMAKAALQRAAPQLLGPGAVTSGTGNGMGPSSNMTGLQGLTQATQTQPGNLISPSSSQPPISPNIPQQAQPVQPEVNPINVSEIMNKYPGFESKINDMMRAKVDPERIVNYFREFNPSQVKKLEKETGKPIDEIILGYIESKAQEPKKALSREESLGAFREGKIQREAQDQFLKEEVKPTSMESQGQELDEAKEAPKITKGSTVASPQGIGEIKEIRNGKALIEIDGKKHQVDEKDLEAPLYSEEEIADAYDEMFKRIPEEHKSGFIQWSGYDEDRNVLGFIPRGGKYEEIENITPEEAELIRKGKGVARTSGEEREGLWVMGEDTRGGVISQIIHDRKRKNKEEEAQQLDFGFELPKAEKQDRGMKPIFDENAYPRSLSQARDKKKRDEERARKKKEKEDEKAKKRKK